MTSLLLLSLIALARADRLAFTVGNAASYDEQLARWARGERGPVHKLGPGVSTGGGSVWHRLDEVLAYLSRNRQSYEPGVYLVVLPRPWHICTAPPHAIDEQDDGWCELMEKARILGRLHVPVPRPAQENPAC